METGLDHLRDLIGEELSGVSFVRDYLQLQFGPPPRLNVFTPMTVQSSGSVASLGQPTFADLLIGQIGKLVVSVSLNPEESLAIQFADQSVITISLLPDDYSCPEAINLFCKDGRLLVM